MRHQFSFTSVSPRILRRLTAAEGYLDLEMPRQALAELDSLDDYGPFEAAMFFLRGQALKAEQRFDEAIAPLQRAAELIPAPHNRAAWISLSECFREQGRVALADALEKFADASQSAHAVPLFKVTLQIEPLPMDEGVILVEDDLLEADPDSAEDQDGDPRGFGDDSPGNQRPGKG